MVLSAVTICVTFPPRSEWKAIDELTLSLRPFTPYRTYADSSSALETRPRCVRRYFSNPLDDKKITINIVHATRVNIPLCFSCVAITYNLRSPYNYGDANAMPALDSYGNTRGAWHFPAHATSQTTGECFPRNCKIQTIIYVD